MATGRQWASLNFFAMPATEGWNREEGADHRTVIAMYMLNGMMSSAPIADRNKIQKAEWARIAVEWADALLEELAK